MLKISRTKKIVLEFGENVSSTDDTIYFVWSVKLKWFAKNNLLTNNNYKGLLNRQQHPIYTSLLL
jgi:hypothetical protein